MILDEAAGLFRFDERMEITMEANPGVVDASRFRDYRRCRDLSQALPLHPSAYNVTIEEGTPFHARYGQGLLKPLDEDVEIEMADRIQHTLAEAGLERYEISNYARPGLESRHNVNYWEGGDYLGVGAGAHSHHRKPDDRWESAGRTSGRRPVT